MPGVRDRVFLESKASGGMFLVIPSVVMLDSELPLSAQMLYGVITWKCGENACTWASNRALGDVLQLSAKRISALLSALEQRGHIETEIEYREGTKEILRRCIYPIVKSSRGILSDQAGGPIPGNEDTPTSFSGIAPLENEDTPSSFSRIPPLKNEEVICNNKIKNKKDINITLDSPTGDGAPSEEPEPPSEGRPPRKGSRPVDINQDIWFEAFWDKYPRKDAKKRARQAWDKLRPDFDTCKAMAAGLAKAKRSKEWTKDGGQYIPHASTWINQRRWEDKGVDPSQINLDSDNPPDSGGWAPDPEVIP